jgi:hypothetical protein
MFILVNDFNGDPSNCGENKGQRGECKENLKKDFRNNQHFVIGINHVQTLQHGDKKTIKIENNIHAKTQTFIKHYVIMLDASPGAPLGG